MRFTVLGSTAAWDGERQIELGPLRRRAVLAALLVDVGRVVPTEVLLDRVWDGAPPPSATGALHAYVSRLRGVLAVPGADAPVTIRTSPRGYALDVAADDVDAHRFAALVERAGQRREDGDAAGAGELLATALALWQGPAYADFSAEFAVAEARRLDDLRLAAHTMAAEVGLELGHHQKLVVPLRALLAEHPLHEGLRASLMSALYRCGQQADALRIYAEGRALLVDELGVDPGAELQALHAAILRQDPSLQAPVAAVAVEPDAVGGEMPVASGTRLVGRAAQLDLLRAALTRAAAGHGQVVAVVGEAGIGKSRLVEEMCAQARVAGHAVAWGRCWQYEGAPALWPWIQIVRDLAPRLEPERLELVLGERAGVLESMVPGLRPGSDPVGLDVATLEQAEVRLFDAILAFVAAVALETPLVLVVDDLHWADRSSQRMVEYAAESLRTDAVTLVVTVRSPSQDVDHPDLAALAALARHDQVQRVDLPPLTAQDVQLLVTDRVGAALDERTAVALHGRTGGNPFYVGEIVRLVITTGAHGALEDGVPDSVRGVIRRRVETLPETDQKVLSAGAVVGRTFDLALLAEVSGVDEDAVDEAVDRATELGLLRSEPGTVDEHRFTHALLQETLLDETGPTRRRRLHRRIGEVLRSRLDSGGTYAVTPDRVAHHFERAGTEPDLATAVRHYLLAADDALARRNHPEVESWLRAGFALIDRLATRDAGLATAVRNRLGSFYLIFDGAYSDERRAALLLEEPDEQASSRDLVTALHNQWGSEHGQNRIASGELVTARMTALGEDRDDDLLRLGGLMTAGYNLLQRGRFAESADHFLRMEHLLPHVGIPAMVFTPHPYPGAPLWRSVAARLMGEDPDDSVWTEASRRAEELGEPVTTTYVDGVRLLRCVWLDDPAAGADAAATVAASTSANDMGMMRVYMSMPSAWALSHSDPAAGVAAADAAIATIQQPDGLVWRPFLLGLYGEILHRAGRDDEALRRLDTALNEAAESQAQFYDAEILRVRATVLQSLGRPADEVRADLERARTVALAQGARLFLARADRALAALR